MKMVTGEYKICLYCLWANDVFPHDGVSFSLITDLQDTALDLDLRVTDLEENGGDGRNSSIAELEIRVETLEETTADQDKDFQH